MLFIDRDRFITYCMYDFKFEIFGVVLVCHITGDDALKQVFIDASGCYMVDDGFHALHEVVCVTIVAVMNEKPNADCNCNTLV